MPIYLENRDVGGTFGAAKHMYLIWAPEGSENTYSEYRTIGAFPATPNIFGPWGVLEATYLGEFLFEATESDKSDQYPVRSSAVAEF
ncbi:hypothetical protein [uncultured Roseobacter sp.]|uniref:hypothetical protein n=1 Tax=uncultured Roseobacter sp. TaxID=114847 RepID=UPI00261FBD04|nr:hypothetical protein [uncultured Roseobacter sp.]